jgi:hypothetical protein
MTDFNFRLFTGHDPPQMSLGLGHILTRVEEEFLIRMLLRSLVVRPGSACLGYTLQVRRNYMMMRTYIFPAWSVLTLCRTIPGIK